ncbi:nucleotide sugar dehydrogenase [Mycobacterium sp. C3-094]
MMRVVVVGQGYVGLPLSVRAAQVGHHVVAYDIDESRIKRLQVGESYIEDISDDVLNDILASGTFHPSSEARACAAFDIAIIAVPTPLREGVPDLRYIEQSAETLGRYLRPGATVVVESTTYPGTTEELVAPILQDGSGLVAGVDFHLGYSPERIDPGNTTWTLVNTPKIVSGIDEASLSAVDGFYRTIVEKTVPVVSPREAELAKLLENTFRHVNIALINEMAIYAHELGIDVWDAIDAASTKPFGFMRFTPGPGVGGHCLPIDPSYLSWVVERTLGHSFRFVELANDINEHMPDHVVRRIAAALNDKKRAVNGSRILLLGMSYKKNTGDARESPSVRVAQLLSSMGAEVLGADPHIVEATPIDSLLKRVEATPEVLESADAVVLLTDHDAFDFEEIVARSTFILDCRHRLQGPNVEHL